MDQIPDDRSRLVFTCCHQAAAASSRQALTLVEDDGERVFPERRLAVLAGVSDTGLGLTPPRLTL